MKNYTLAVIAGLLMLSPVVASASFDTSLKYGARGQAVIELQDLLASEDCLSVNSTGYFGLLTLKAVKCFQTKYNLPSTGFFGVMSRTKANEIVATITAPSNAAAQAETTTPNQPSTTKPKTFTLPNGTVIDSQGNIISTPPTVTTPQNTFVDVCLNIEGVQTTVPGGMTATGNVCVVAQATPPPTDLCPNISGLQTTIPAGKILQNGDCVTPAPTPTPTTSLLLPKRLNYGGQASWPNGNNYGNVNDSCNNCVVLITEMPTTANVYLMEYTALRGGAALDGYAANNPQIISVYADNNLSATHVFLFSHMGMDSAKKYLFIVDATDQNGKKFIQQFGGVDSSSTYLPGPFKWGENQTISWVSDYPSQYMKSNYYVDVPLTKVQ